MKRKLAAAAVMFVSSFAASMLWAGDQPQWGQRNSRNMVSDEKGLPAEFNPATGKNIKWIANLGDQSYSTPIVANGHVLIGTNNERPRDVKHQGDRGVFMCFNERDGSLAWQLVVPKLEDDPYLDWPKVGMASAATVEGDRVYLLSNRGEVLCLDLKGMSDGNDGPYRDEAKHMAPRGSAPIMPGPSDADIIWACDLVKEAGIHTHDQVEGSVLIDGDLLYVNSCNGVDNTHRVIRSPDAPTLVVLDKRTGKIVARDGEHIGPNIFHCAWSSPSLGVVNGRKLIFFGGPDGYCYAFDALAGVPTDGPIATLKTVWKFDADPTRPPGDVHQYLGNYQHSPAEILGMPVFHENRVYVASGGDVWWGKRKGWLKCLDATQTGVVTKTAQVWSYELSKETCCTPAVYEGLVFATDCGGVVHCVDAMTGKPYWTYKLGGEIWASPLVADGKVYVGSRRGTFAILAANKEQHVLSTVELGDAVSATATAANGVLYFATMTHLFAVQQQGG